MRVFVKFNIPSFALEFSSFINNPLENIQSRKNNEQQQYETWFLLIILHILFFTEYFMQITLNLALQCLSSDFHSITISIFLFSGDEILK